MRKKVNVTWLEMDSKEQFIPKKGFKDAIEIKQVKNIKFLNLMLFLQVGLSYRWYERLFWNNEQWQEYYSTNNASLYLGFKNDAIIGYYELEKKESDVEIKYFGLIPEYTGAGLGGYFLSCSIESAWELGAKRIYLQTCDLDNKYAIDNYLSRGFSIEKVEEKLNKLPDKEAFITRISDYFSAYYEDLNLTPKDL